ncbi:hypothetical protein BGW41_006551 [Actinomortierella wolfii]|nr:hypothetical protein BGW41_006551 [Actinomortierella wolfii]
MAAPAEHRESHLISLKVMRLSRPSLVMKQGIFFDKDHHHKANTTSATIGLEPNTTSILTDALSDLSLTQLERVHPPSSLTTSAKAVAAQKANQGLAGDTIPSSTAEGEEATMQDIDLDASTTPSELNIGDFGLSELLALPASFGNIYLGETFTSYICANNESSHPVRDVILKAELQTSTLRFTLSDTLGSMRQHQQTLQAGVANDPRLSPKPPASQSPHSPASPGAHHLHSPGAGTGGGGHVQLLEAGKTNEMIVSHEIKELGIHILVCSVQYTTLDGQQKSFRKFYKFQVMNPLSVKTKVNQISSSSGTLTMPNSGSGISSGTTGSGRDSRDGSGTSGTTISGQKTITATEQSGKVLLEAMIQNMSGVTLWMERMKFEAAAAFTVHDLNVVLDEHGQPVQKIPQGDANQEQPQQPSSEPGQTPPIMQPSSLSSSSSTSISIFGEHDYFAPNEVRQYLYLLHPKPGKELLAKTTNVLGKMDIVWRSPLGESGRLQTSPLTRHPAQLQKIAVQVVHVPDRIRLEEIFTIELVVRNQSLPAGRTGDSAPLSTSTTPPPTSGSTRLFETVAAGGSALPTRPGDLVRPPTAVSRGPSLTRMDSSSSQAALSSKRADGSDGAIGSSSAAQQQQDVMKLMLTGVKQKMGSVLLSGANSRSLGQVMPGGEVRVKLDWFPLMSGVQKIGGLRIVDIVSGFTLELDHLTYCFVEHT